MTIFRIIASESYTAVLSLFVLIQDVMRYLSFTKLLGAIPGGDLMPNKKFDWDNYFLNASWSEVREKSPLFDCQRQPSLVHQEEELVYLSSLDLDCALSDGVALESAMTDVKSVLEDALETKNYYRAAVASTDSQIIERLLSDQGIYI